MEQEGRSRKHQVGKWYIWLKYLAGVLLLVFTVLLALFLPGWYSEWRDAQTMEEVVLTAQERIKFLDTDALDVSARLKMLSESKDFGFVEGLGNDYGWSDESALEQTLEKYRKSLKKWGRYHLLPESAWKAVSRNNLLFTASWYVETEAGLIPVRVLSFLEPNLIAIMDQDNGFLYYVGITSDLMYEYVVWCLGEDSIEEKDPMVQIEKMLESDEYSLSTMRDSSACDFAEACKASSQKATAKDNMEMYLGVELPFEDFTAMAYREMYWHNGFWGMAVMFGSEQWRYMAYASAMYTGDNDYEMTLQEWVESWNDTVLEFGNTTLLQDMPEETEALVQEEYYKDGYPAEEYGKSQGDSLNSGVNVDKME